MNENRLYPRFSIFHNRIGQASINGKEIGIIREISYGGFSVLLTGDFSASSDEFSKPRLTLTVTLFGQMLECWVRPVFFENDVLGFCFEHENSDTLMFLRPLLTFIQYGAGLRWLERADGDMNDMPEDFNSEGMEDGSVTVSSDGFKVIYKEGRAFYSCECLRGQNILTCHNVGPAAEVKELTAMPMLDKKVVQKTLCIFLGFSEGNIEPPLSHWVDVCLDAVQALDLPVSGQLTNF